MSFYVTLPSNSSLQFYPNNTCTNYVSKLKSTIELEGPHEVALSEISFPFNWTPVIDGGIIVRNNKLKTHETIKLTWTIDQNINEIIDYLNKTLHKKSFAHFFSYNSQTYIISVFIPNDFAIEFVGSTHKELGFKFKIIEASPRNNLFHASTPIPPIANKLSSIFVYTDIIDHQFVGDSFAPLLRTISVPNSLRYGDNINHNNIQPHYVPVCKANFDNIEIDLRSDTGEPIQFASGKVIVKLHFRPKRIY
jgi:hypothetical protein